MTKVVFRSPIKIGVNEALTLSRVAENTGHTIYIRKNKKDKFLTMNSILGFFSLRIKKGNTITLLCDLDGRAGENILNEVKTNFEILT